MCLFSIAIQIGRVTRALQLFVTRTTSCRDVCSRCSLRDRHPNTESPKACSVHRRSGFCSLFVESSLFLVRPRPTVDRRRRLAAFGRTKKVPRLALVRGALISRLFPRYVRIAGPIQGHKEKPDIYTFFLVKNRSMLYVRNSYSPYPFIGVVFLGWNVYYGDAGAHVPSASDSFTSSGCSWRWLLDEC